MSALKKASTRAAAKAASIGQRAVEVLILLVLHVLDVVTVALVITALLLALGVL